MSNSMNMNLIRSRIKVGKRAEVISFKLMEWYRKENPESKSVC